MVTSLLNIYLYQLLVLNWRQWFLQPAGVDHVTFWCCPARTSSGFGRLQQSAPGSTSHLVWLLYLFLPDVLQLLFSRSSGWVCPHIIVPLHLKAHSGLVIGEQASVVHLFSQNCESLFGSFQSFICGHLIVLLIHPGPVSHDGLLHLCQLTDILPGFLDFGFWASSS